MALNANGVGVGDVLSDANTGGRPGEFGNDDRVEALWAIKAMEHAEVYFNILCSVEPSQIPRLSPCDEDIYSYFRKEFPDMNVAFLDETGDLKSEEMKKRWRSFCEKFKHVEDYSFATLVRLDSSGDYEESNSSLVAKIQFYAIELARNREGHNDCIKSKFKPKVKTKGKTSTDRGAIGNGDSEAIAPSIPLGKSVERELEQILMGNHNLQR